MKLLVGLFLLYLAYRVVRRLFSQKDVSKRPEPTFRHDILNADESAPAPSSRSRKKPTQWYGKDRPVTVQGYDIPGGLIYVGERLPDIHGYGDDACLINPRLKVSPAEPWEAGDEMDYWPRYATIPAKCRGAYLKWPATGRSEPETYIGYVFLFFYGLERRLFVDGQREGISDRERREIIDEVKRLLAIYGSNRSFRRYAHGLLAMEWMVYRSDEPVPDYLDLNDRYCLPSFQFLLARMVAEGKPIPADLALQWYTLHPDFGLKTPARRCAREFRELFAARYEKCFGAGLVVKPNKTPLKVQYRAASPSLAGGLKLRTPDIPNPFILTAPLKKLSGLVEECTADLEPYSRWLARKGADADSLDTLALLPDQLKSKSPNVIAAKGSLARICANGPTLIDVDVLYEGFGRESPERMTKKDAENLAIVMQAAGFGMAPDVRFHPMKPDPGGKVAVFPQGHGSDFRPSPEFRTMGAVLRLGALVSQIDRDLSPAEEATLRHLIRDDRRLTDIEKNSLSAFLTWCMRTPQGAAGLKPILSRLDVPEKNAISRILISVAHADGRIAPKEVRQLEKLYASIGLEKDRVAGDIHALAAETEPVTVAFRDREPIFSVPKPRAEPPPAKRFQLNEELIRIREEETRQVQGVLERIFSERTEEALEAETPSGDVVSNKDPLVGLDRPHRKLFDRLITKETWDRTAFHELCKELGLMVDGAMEVLNEWAFDTAHAPLLDDGDPVYVDVSLAKEMIDAQ